MPGRYDRQIALPELGAEGQRRLRAARVLLVGAGGLGSPAALYLTAAGVGALTIVEFDAVDLSNLHRQVLYDTPSVGRSKGEAARARLQAMNPDVEIAVHADAFSTGNARALVRAHDIVIDGTDNFATRYLVNDACVFEQRPNVYGSVSRFDGQVAIFGAPGGPCYRCLHPEPPPDGLIPNCAEAGVLGVLPGVIGTLQATEAIKWVTGLGEPLVGRVLLYDALRMRFRQIALARDPECPVCGTSPTIHDLASYDFHCAPVAARPTPPIVLQEPTPPMTTTTPSSMTVDDLRAWRADDTPHALIDVREPSEHAVAHIDGARLIPLATLPHHLDGLPRDRPIVVYCHSGGRSARATAFLRAQGYDARNLLGGMLSWPLAPDAASR